MSLMCAAAGLEPEKDTIIEIACLITNGDLTKVLEVSMPARLRNQEVVLVYWPSPASHAHLASSSMHSRPLHVSTSAGCHIHGADAADPLAGVCASPALTHQQTPLPCASCPMLPIHFTSLIQTLQGPEIAIHHPDSVLEGMNDWCKEHHNKSGLVQRVRDSTISLQEAEQQVRGLLFV